MNPWKLLGLGIAGLIALQGVLMAFNVPSRAISTVCGLLLVALLVTVVVLAVRRHRKTPVRVDRGSALHRD